MKYLSRLVMVLAFATNAGAQPEIIYDSMAFDFEGPDDEPNFGDFAIDGNTVLATHKGESTLYVFELCGSTIELVDQVSYAPYTGGTVHIDGDDCVVSFSDEIAPPAGVARMFHRSGGKWQFLQDLSLNDTTPFLLGNVDVSLSLNRMIHGRSVWPYGAVYTHVKVGGVWIPEAVLTAATPVHLGLKQALS